ncbi:MAG: hypothetical protein ACTHJ6_14820, partial [Oryzihumus sp.]
MDLQGADAGDTAGTDLAGSGAAPTPGRDAASDWAAITELTGELSSRTARVIGQALTGRVDTGRVRLLGEDAAAVRASLAAHEPAPPRTTRTREPGGGAPPNQVVVNK